ncbi:MAG: thiolase [Alphaproteobacteria bacterium]|nr:thiolase [Alphaproteobacteria bacterium]
MTAGTGTLQRKVAIVGAAETDALGKLPHMSRLALNAQAARKALEDAGLSFRDVDGIFSSVADPNELSEYFGIVPRYVDGTSVGGCSYIIHVRHAVAAIAAGYCSVALIVHGESGRSWIDMDRPGNPASPTGQFEAPFGASGAPTLFSIPVLRHFHQYGTTKQQMSHVPAATREWALLNPKAIMHKAGPITPEDVMASRMVCYPFNLLDCCLVADGGGALVLVGADRARDCRRKPVYVLGTGEAAAHRQVGMMRDFTMSDSSTLSGRLAFAEAGLGPADIRHLMFYDAFSFTPMMFLEDLGYCGRGESGPFVAETRKDATGRTIYKTGPGGALPMNTNGGGLSYCHTGRYGMFALLEAVYQLRGEAGARQIPGLDVSLVHGPGRHFAAAGTLILANR